MKGIKLIALFLFASVAQVFAQDLIITTKNDSIRCKILEEGFNEISYQLGSDLTGMITKIRTSEVKQIRRDYLQQTNSSKAKGDISSDINNTKTHTHRFFIQAGPSYVSAKTIKKDVDYLDEQEKQLKTGYHFELGYNYYGERNFGLGARLLNFRSKYSKSNVAIEDDNGVIRYGDLGSDINVLFTGLTLGGKIPANNKKINFNANISVGYTSFVNNGVELSSYTLKSSQMGYYYQLGVDYQLSKKIWAGISANVFSSKIKEIELTNSSGKLTMTLNPDKYINISRVELGLGLRYVIQ